MSLSKPRAALSTVVNMELTLTLGNTGGCICTNANPYQSIFTATSFHPIKPSRLKMKPPGWFLGCTKTLDHP